MSWGKAQTQQQTHLILRHLSPARLVWGRAWACLQGSWQLGTGSRLFIALVLPGIRAFSAGAVGHSGIQNFCLSLADSAPRGGMPQGSLCFTHELDMAEALAGPQVLSEGMCSQGTSRRLDGMLCSALQAGGSVLAVSLHPCQGWCVSREASVSHSVGALVGSPASP